VGISHGQLIEASYDNILGKEKEKYESSFVLIPVRGKNKYQVG
jgi:hypothetical protein